MEVPTRPFDILINHRGPDVKNTVASTIYRWLKDKGLEVFLDKDEFEPGQELLSTIKDAITTSSAHVAIFSKHYAESSWCLEELRLMVERPKVPIIAVFYDVKPSDLRRIETGTYAEAFARHVQKGRFDSEKIDAWKAALGKISNEYGDLGALLHATVHAVLKALPKVQLPVAKHPVGIDEAAKDFEAFRLTNWQNQQVNIFGIVGMAGLGKTTLAKALYNSNHSSFSGSSFLFDVNLHDDSLQTLQSRLLKDLFGGKLRIFNSTSHGLWTLESRLKSCKSKKFFIVLDGIDGRDQLDALFPKGVKDALGAGSLIIVTSRDKGLLTRSGISLHYEMKPLDPKHARELFCWNAFEQPSPLDGFEDLVNESLSKCNGLPCCLEDIGQYLRSEYILEECRGGLHSSGILKEALDTFFRNESSKVKHAYENLKEEQRQIFLDIACFFVGESTQLATRIWESEPKWKGARCLKILEAKCLVELGCGRLKMHSAFQILGKCIAKKEPPYRICGLDQDKDVVNQWKGREIRGIVAATEDRHESGSFFRALLEKMQLLGDHSENSSQTSSLSVGLKILVLNGDCFESKFGKLSTDLAWLRWKVYPHTSIPSWLPMANLRVLDIEGSHIQNLWQDEAPLQLRELKIRCRNALGKIPQSIGSLTHLEKVVLDCGECICADHTIREAFRSIRSLRDGELYCQRCQTVFRI